MSTPQYFVGIDWADSHHDVVIVDAQGERVGAPFQVPHSVEGLHHLTARVCEVAGEAGPESVVCVVELRHGLLVWALLEAGLPVYPVNPSLVQKRRKASGVKTDRIDALILARVGRNELPELRRLQPESALIAELKELTRDQDQLISAQTRLLNQVTACLKAYYPQALSLFSDPLHPARLAFLRAYPTPQQARRASVQELEQVLKEAGFARWRRKAAEIVALLQQPALQASEVTVRSKARLLVALLAQLEPLHAQIEAYDEAITPLFLSHPNQSLVKSLPRSGGTRIGPRVLAELGDQMDRYGSASDLQALAGTRPAAYGSGNFHEDRARRACVKPLRNALYELARQSTLEPGWAQELYRKKRKEGKQHAESVRIVSNTWARILFAMFSTQTCYDAQRFEEAQRRHQGPRNERGVA